LTDDHLVSPARVSQLAFCNATPTNTTCQNIARDFAAGSIDPAGRSNGHCGHALPETIVDFASLFGNHRSTRQPVEAPDGGGDAVLRLLSADANDDAVGRFFDLDQ
jgi:hypothetical protein